MGIELKGNKNYAAQIVRVPEPRTLPGLDNLVGYPVLGSMVLSQREGGVVPGELAVYFPTETRLSNRYASANNLYRHAENNSDTSEKGYLDDSGRVRAIKLRGHQSNALLMPLESLTVFTDPNALTLFSEGEVFDHVNGEELCRKYEIKQKGTGLSPSEKKVKKAFKRVTDKVFPAHLDTDNFWRNKHLLRADREVVITQKLHGTSVRIGRVPVLRKLSWFERTLRKMGVRVEEIEFDNVYGSRKVIKDVNNPDQNHYYGTDVWTATGKKLDGLIPDGYVVYGELVGWTPDGSPIQSGYTYDLKQGESEFYVYRVATVNAAGVLSDLSWSGVEEFCSSRGLKHVPVVVRLVPEHNTFGIAPDEYVSLMVDSMMDRRYADELNSEHEDFNFVPLSGSKSVDEGVVVRQEGVVPVLLKAKSPVFLNHETKALDKEEVDLESAA